MTTFTALHQGISPRLSPVGEINVPELILSFDDLNSGISCRLDEVEAVCTVARFTVEVYLAWCV